MYICDDCLEVGDQVEATHHYVPMEVKPDEPRTGRDVCKKHLIVAEANDEKCFRIGHD